MAAPPNVFTAYPAALDSLTQTFDVGQVAVVNDAVEAIEAKLGTGASTAVSGDVLTGTGTGATAWAQLAGYGFVKAREYTFTETSGAGTWTLLHTIPAGGTLLDVIVFATAVWNSQTSAVLDVGITTVDADGLFAAVNMIATDLTIGQSISFAQTGGKEGALFSGTNTHVDSIHFPTENTVEAALVKVGTTGTLGRTRITVVWSEPASATAVAKV
jgi:hypothetical protein